MSIALVGDPLTPVEERNGRLYKRDDLYGYTNGVNGKTRTSLWLARQAAENGALGLVYGGSVLAPALGRVASAAAVTGLECRLVIGSNLDTARRHRTVAVAEEAGATFVRSSVAYNPELQRHAARLADGKAWLQVPYGVSTPAGWDPELVRDFLNADLGQTVPVTESGATTLVIPFGSANAATSVFYDLALNGCGDLKDIILVGVGPDKREWFEERLRYVGVGKDLVGQFPFRVSYLPLHPHFAEYADKMPESRDGIDFHPTYEGKVVRFLDVLKPAWWTRRDGRTCLWIVGGPL